MKCVINELILIGANSTCDACGDKSFKRLEGLLMFTKDDRSVWLLDNRCKDIGSFHYPFLLCPRCRGYLIGLEDYYDVFYPKIIEHYWFSAKRIMRSILHNKKLKRLADKAIREGNYIPREIIWLSYGLENG